MSKNNKRHIGNFTCLMIEVIKKKCIFRYVWPTRDCFVLHKVKHHHSHRHPGHECNQSYQQLRRHLQLPEEPQTFGPEGARLWCRHSIGPSGWRWTIKLLKSLWKVNSGLTVSSATWSFMFGLNFYSKFYNMTVITGLILDSVYITICRCRSKYQVTVVWNKLHSLSARGRRRFVCQFISLSQL